MPIATNVLSAAQCRAGRAMLDWSAERLSKAAAVDVGALKAFESKFRRLDDNALRRIRAALEQAGIAFIPDSDRGAGVRFKFNVREVRAIRRWEAEGGRAGDDAIYG